MNKVKRLARKRYYVKIYGDEVAADILSDNRSFGHRRQLKPEEKTDVPSVVNIRQSRMKQYLKKISAGVKGRMFNRKTQ